MRFKVTVIVAGERFSARAISFWLMPSRLCSRAWQALNTAKPCMIATNVRMITVFGTKIRQATASSVSRMEI